MRLLLRLRQRRGRKRDRGEREHRRSSGRRRRGRRRRHRDDDEARGGGSGMIPCDVNPLGEKGRGRRGFKLLLELLSGEAAHGQQQIALL